MNGALIVAISNNVNDNYSYSYSYSDTNTAKKSQSSTTEPLFETASQEEIKANQDKIAEYDKQLKANQERLLSK